MDDMVGMVEMRIPDVVSTADLPVRLAAEIDFFAGRVDRWCGQSAESSRAVTARSLAFLGRNDQALTALDGFDPTSASRIDLAAASWAASRVGGPMVAPLLAQLDTIGDDFLEDDVPVGPRRMYVGALHAATGDLAAAEEHLVAAVETGDARAPLWGALCRLELGRALRTAEAIPVGAARTAKPVLTSAKAFFAAGGYRSLLARVEDVAGPVSATLVVGRPSRVGFGTQPAVEVRSSKGLTALRYLVENGHRVVTAAELACVIDGGDAERLAALTQGEWMADLAAFDGGAAEATDAIRAVFFDESTRSRITKLVRRTIQKLAESHSLIAGHLDAAITTGHGCRYHAMNGAVRWGFDGVE